jgi:hypothetical protein
MANGRSVRTNRPLPPERRQELEKAAPPCKVMPGGEGIAYFSHDDGHRLAAVK